MVIFTALPCSYGASSTIRVWGMPYRRLISSRVMTPVAITRR
jgi:hypothetical protein